MSRNKLTYAQKNCIASAGKLMQQLSMIQPGSRIGVAVSGGVDSLTLLEVLLHRQRILPFRIELMALSLNPGFDPEAHKHVARFAIEKGVAVHTELTDHGLEAHSDRNRKNSACFLCSKRRRTRLFELCRDYDLTHLAFGHNADDLVSTFFMNLFQGGRVETLSPIESFFDGRLMVIRPLLWLEKCIIKRAARKWALPVEENPCPSAATSNRTRTFEWFCKECGNDARKKNNVLNALRRSALDHTIDLHY
ncbi:tRNA lysidine(34) synthetase [Oceanidesulfovibrio marinus]|uniref:tRNA 2-thiocytidine biosynthesis protein TtcA n=1 Tax=Oceanidesulfovibrio marinus TaxID=370038 RepID=A0ABX6NJJ0_9BACT|nr:tRNA 2-thiocytidine biosynthesis TtcA family protein [Oceanidesulfovibrio marinus]QJT10386.1 tRNA 2-thiocytidine biosynthesis protein TtcA [Oceanidesulfovibrio marinus]